MSRNPSPPENPGQELAERFRMLTIVMNDAAARSSLDEFGNLLAERDRVLCELEASRELDLRAVSALREAQQLEKQLARELDRCKTEAAEDLAGLYFGKRATAAYHGLRTRPNGMAFDRTG